MLQSVSSDSFLDVCKALIASSLVEYGPTKSLAEISLGLRPWEISRVSGNLSGVGDGFPDTSLVLVEHG